MDYLKKIIKSNILEKWWSQYYYEKILVYIKIIQNTAK